jgi:hypothetical protein
MQELALHLARTGPCLKHAHGKGMARGVDFGGPQPFQTDLPDRLDAEGLTITGLARARVTAAGQRDKQRRLPRKPGEVWPTLALNPLTSRRPV